MSMIVAGELTASIFDNNIYFYIHALLTIFASPMWIYVEPKSSPYFVFELAKL